MPAQHLVLSWKDHNGALVSVFENLLKNNSLVDCTLAAEGQYLKAHKLVLSACSCYFELLFSQESEKNPIVILKDVKFQELEAAVNFMYRGEVAVCEDRLAEFLEVAESLQIKGLGSDGKVQDSKEKASVKSSSAKSVLDPRQQFRKEDSNHIGDTTGESSNVPADCKHIRKNESSSVDQLSRRGSSPALTASTFSAGSSSCPDRKETHRDSNSLENIQQSLALPSFTSGGNVLSEENPIIKTEPETDTFLEDQSDEAEGDFEDDVVMIDDQDDCEKPNTGTMDVLPTYQQDIGYPSEHLKTQDNTSENVEEMHLGNGFSLEGAGWIQPNDQPNFASVYVKEDPSTLASWSQEAVAYGASVSGDRVEPSAGTSAASAGVDNFAIKDIEHLRQASVQFYPPVTGICRADLSWKMTDASLQPTTPQPPSPKFICPRCKELFVQMMDLERHLHSQSCNTLPSVSEGELPPNDTALPKPSRLQKSLQPRSFKCSECNYATHRRHDMVNHFYVHTGEKPFKCSHCNYASSLKKNLAKHLRTHRDEKPHKCPHCSLSFVQKCSLLNHIRTHMGE